MTELNGSATPANHAAGSPADNANNGAANSAPNPPQATQAAMQAGRHDPLAAPPSDLASHPLLAAYRKADGFDLGGL